MFELWYVSRLYRTGRHLPCPSEWAIGLINERLWFTVWVQRRQVIQEDRGSLLWQIDSALIFRSFSSHWSLLDSGLSWSTAPVRYSPETNWRIVSTSSKSRLFSLQGVSFWWLWQWGSTITCGRNWRIPSWQSAYCSWRWSWFLERRPRGRPGGFTSDPSLFSRPNSLNSLWWFFSLISWRRKVQKLGPFSSAFSQRSSFREQWSFLLFISQISGQLSSWESSWCSCSSSQARGFPTFCLWLSSPLRSSIISSWKCLIDFIESWAIWTPGMIRRAQASNSFSPSSPLGVEASLDRVWDRVNRNSSFSQPLTRTSSFLSLGRRSAWLAPWLS